MGSLPGPIITFRIASESVAPAIDAPLREVRAKSQAVTDGIAADWKRAAAQIRASIAQNASDTTALAAGRQNLVAILDKEITGLRTRNELSNRELATLKAATLERERQADAIRRGVSVGVTGGTSSALGQVSQQTVLGIERIFDSVINRYLGGAAGAAARTIRDVGYYSSLAGRGAFTAEGSEGGTGAILSGFTGGIVSLTSGINPSVLAVGGLGLALAAVGITAVTVTKNMGDLAQEIRNTSAATGLSVTQVQQYSELTKEMGLETGSLTTTFGRLQSQIGEYITKGKSADESTQAFVRVLNSQGVALKNSDGSIRSVNDILEDFSEKLAGISDKGERTALTLEAFGSRGRIIAQLFSQASLEGKSFAQVLKEAGDRSGNFSESQINDLALAKVKWDEWEGSVVGSLKAAGLAISEFTLSSNKGSILGELLAGNIAGAGVDLLGERGSSSKAGPLDSGFAAAAAARARFAKELNDQLLQRAEIIKDGGKAQLELSEAEKNYASALKDGHGEAAAAYATEITRLKAVIDLQKQSAEQLERNQKLYSEFALNPSTGSLAGARGARDIATLRSNLANPGSGVDPLSLGIDPLSIGFGQNPLAGIIGPAAKSPLDAAGLLAQINKEHEDLFRSQASIDAEHYQDELDSLNDALKQQLISQQEYSASVIKLNQDRNKTLSDADKKYEDEAGSIFEDLISGKTKNLGQTVTKDVENILLAPIKKIFEQQVGGIFDSLAKLVSPNGGGAAPAGGGNAGPSGGILGKILGKFGGLVGIGGTPGTFPGAIGSAPGGGVGQTTISTPLMNVTAQVVNIVQGASVAGSLVPGGGFPGSLFGGIGGTGGFGSFFGNTNPFGASFGPGGLAGGAGSTASAAQSSLGKVFSTLSPFAAGAALLGVGAATGNESAIALGAASLAGKAASAISGISGLPAGLSSALGTFGAAAPGFGLAASGIISADQSNTVGGKIGGTLEAGAGGALAGLAIGGPIGAAIGGAVGLIGGAIASIIGGGPQGFAASVHHALTHDQYHAPLSENFSFASNGSIANTLQTGFQQNGSKFSQYNLPANTPFFGSAITGNLTWQQLYQLQNSGLNPNAPFLGNPSTNPFVGQGPVGSKATTPPPTVQVHVNLPGFVDATSAAAAFTPHAQLLSQIITKTISSSSSGFGNNVRRAAFLP